MSRYEITDVHSSYYCIVGFDPPLGTFFAQVYRNKGPQGPSSLVQWIGTDVQEIQTVEELTNAIAAYVTVPHEIQQQLARDSHTGFQPNFGTRILQHLQQHDKEERR
jgi:hypothetical protein